MSSAEFKNNSDLYATLFGLPKYYESGRITNLFGATQALGEISRPISLVDIDKLKAWEEDKREMKGLYDVEGSKIMKDINQNYWVSIGGSGFSVLWSVGVGSLESGKYPI